MALFFFLAGTQLYLHVRRYTGPALTKALPRQDGEEMLRAAMAAERSTAARRTEDPFADLGVSFKEVELEQPFATVRTNTYY